MKFIVFLILVGGLVVAIFGKVKGAEFMAAMIVGRICAAWVKRGLRYRRDTNAVARRLAIQHMNALYANEDDD